MLDYIFSSFLIYEFTFRQNVQGCRNMEAFFCWVLVFGRNQNWVHYSVGIPVTMRWISCVVLRERCYTRNVILNPMSFECIFCFEKINLLAYMVDALVAMQLVGCTTWKLDVQLACRVSEWFLFLGCHTTAFLAPKLCDKNACVEISNKALICLITIHPRIHIEAVHDRLCARCSLLSSVVFLFC
jgi:hypothetical protein